MKKGYALAVVSLMLAGLGAVFHNMDVNAFSEALLVIFVMVFGLGGALMGLASLLIESGAVAKILGALAVGLNAWLLIAALG